MIGCTLMLMIGVVIFGCMLALAGVQTDAGFTTAYIILLIVVVLGMMDMMGVFNKKDK